MSVLVPCPHCARHVRAAEASCPFCATALPGDLASRAVPAAPRRMNRIATLTFASAIAIVGTMGAGCSDGPDAGEGSVGAGREQVASSGTELTAAPRGGDGLVDNGSSVAMYGKPPPPPPEEDAVDDNGSSVAMYGLPPPPPPPPDDAVDDNGSSIAMYGLPPPPPPEEDAVDDNGSSVAMYGKPPLPPEEEDATVGDRGGPVPMYGLPPAPEPKLSPTPAPARARPDPSNRPAPAACRGSGRAARAGAAPCQKGRARPGARPF